MEKSAIDGYVEKLAVMISGCIDVHTVFSSDIKPRNTENPMQSMFWLQGAQNGVLIYFFRTLSADEQEINMLVLNEATHIIGGTEKPLDVMDYIDAAVTVLGRLGIRIALPEDKLPPRR
ncbi:MAG: hypothetical protein NC081_05385 [Roseburia sp.]|nr:hypothetical protein [Lachnospiraceae bacterium]MCM1568865.1 hypothetical protein [Roseburia sp.]